jgi:nicotinamide-nucleotide amidase
LQVSCGTLPSMPQPRAEPSRPILTAELLAIGTELTVGETRDTNTGDLAGELTALGIRVLRLHALPDDLAIVTDAFTLAAQQADIVISTGGLGPTPDDLTREAIAASCGEVTAVDPDLEGWLRGLWDRRGMPFPELNLKQAWLIPSAVSIPNPNGSAPGWWVDRQDGGVIVALPGPPREMRPMWHDWVLPHLADRQPGRESVRRTLRLTGIGESQVADLLGEDLLRAANPAVATYARADAVDVRISAVGEEPVDGRPGRTPAELVDGAEALVRERVGGWIWGTGATSWPEALGQRLVARGWSVAAVELGTGGALSALFGDASWLRLAESRPGGETGSDEADLEGLAEDVRRRAATEVGIGLRARPKGEDTSVSIALVTPDGVHRERRLAFLGGSQGRARAAVIAAAALLAKLDGRTAESAGRSPNAHPQRPIEEVRR